MRAPSAISADPRFLRGQIREGILNACQHGDQCPCPQRRQWEAAILEIYRAERATEQQQPKGIPIMNEKETNGAAPPEETEISLAIKRHAAMLLRINTMPNGMMAINPAQLFCDIELLTVRLEVLFEAMVERGLIDPQALVERMRDKLSAESDEMERQLADGPQLQIVHGSLPRNR